MESRRDDSDAVRLFNIAAVEVVMLPEFSIRIAVKERENRANSKES